VVVAIVAVAVVLAAVLSTGGSAAPDTGPVARVQPFSLGPVVSGATAAALGAAPGRPTVVAFFAAWCDPCRAELPLVEAASRAVGGPAVVGVDVLDQRPDAEALMRQAGVSFPAGFDHDGTVSQRWGVVGLPVTVFVAPDGHIVSYHRGELRARQLGDLLKGLARAS
jgi:cytochrome c biogenesis protein CcmG/thiol:disulfide interchange protein DsbE